MRKEEVLWSFMVVRDSSDIFLGFTHFSALDSSDLGWDLGDQSFFT